MTDRTPKPASFSIFHGFNDIYIFFLKHRLELIKQKEALKTTPKYRFLSENYFRNRLILH